MHRFITHSIPATTCALALLVLSGCPTEPELPDVVPPSNNTTVFNNTDNNSNNTNNTNNTTPTNNTTQTNNSNNSNNTNNTTPPGERDACANINRLGELSATEGTLRWTGDTTPLTVNSAYQSSCGFGIAPEQAFGFSFDGPVSLRFKVRDAGAIRFAYELSEGPCETVGDPIFCNSTDQTFLAQGDTDYVLVVEPEANQARGPFTIEVDVTPLVCLPVASKRCEGDDVKRCSGGGTREDTISCGAPCVNGDCGANACDTSVRINPGQYPYTFSAPSTGYNSTITFEGDNSCANPDRGILPGTNNANPGGESDPSLPTPGQDVHFTLAGLTAGQLVTVDASENANDFADSAIFILKACDKTECLWAQDLGDVVSQWEVPEDGDYLVIVDRVSSSDQDLGVIIDVE